MNFQVAPLAYLTIFFKLIYDTKRRLYAMKNENKLRIFIYSHSRLCTEIFSSHNNIEQSASFSYYCTISSRHTQKKFIHVCLLYYRFNEPIQIKLLLNHQNNVNEKMIREQLDNFLLS